MSDGGINFAWALGADSAELAKPILVRPGWLEHVRERWDELAAELRRAASNLHWSGDWQEPKIPRPAVTPTVPDEGIIPFIEKVAHGDDVFPGWSWKRANAVDAIHSWNETLDNAWFYQLGLAGKRPRTKKAQREAGYTEVLTPEAWLKVRSEFKRFRISPRAYTKEIWRQKTETLMEFLRDGRLPDGFSMDGGKPKLPLRTAANIVWFLGQTGFLNCDTIDICDDCGSVLETDSETHDWCSKCGKMRCENCTTAPHYCQCDNPCGKHCKCKPDEDA